MIEQPIYCNGKHHKIRLGTINNKGLYYWCKSCHGRHFIPREEIIKMWEDLDALEEENTSTTARPVLY